MRPREIRIPVDLIPTVELLRLHERDFGPLDPIGKRRLLQAARTNGWDRGCETDAIAA
jgi:hypothetical protein